MSQADAPAADWYPDPSGRFQFRYWDGESWTGHVSTDGNTDWDPPGDAPTEEAAQSNQQSDDQSPEQQPVETQPSGQTPAAQSTQDPDAEPVAAVPAEVAEAEQADTAEAMSATENQWAPQTQATDPVQGGTIEEGEPSDTNLVANQRAGLDADVEAWLDEVAGQVEPRLSRIEGSWTSQPQAEAARACAYGLLVGHLAHLHPHMRSDLSQVAEAHPSFTTLEEGARLDTLEQIARDPQRTAAWLGPLIGTEDVDRVKMLFD